MNKRDKYRTRKTPRLHSGPALVPIIEPPTIRGSEEEWFDATSFRRLAWSFNSIECQRKRRLLILACCERFAMHLEPGVFQSIIPAGQALADGLLPETERQHLWEMAWSITKSYNFVVHTTVYPAVFTVQAFASYALLDAISDQPTSIHGLESLSTAASLAATRKLPTRENVVGAEAKKAEELWQVKALRDIFGNPFRPVAFDPAWRTQTPVGIAVKMYEDRDFAAMPILADALEEAGCDHPDILSHCREPGVHVRGCWVVDLVLGKG